MNRKTHSDWPDFALMVLACLVVILLFGCNDPVEFETHGRPMVQRTCIDGDDTTHAFTPVYQVRRSGEGHTKYVYTVITVHGPCEEEGT